MIILEGLPDRVALGLAAARGRSGKKFLEGIKVERAPIAAVKKAVYERAPKFVAELPVMASIRPSVIVEKLRIGIDPGAGIGAGCAQFGEIAHADGGQAEILRPGPKVQADRVGVEAAVLGEEMLFQAVVAPANFHEQALAEKVRIGKRGDVEVGRSNGIEPRQDAPAHQPQGKALVAVSIIVAARQKIIVSEVM